MAYEDRTHALRRFRRRAMLVLYPLAAGLIAATIFFNARGSPMGFAALAALLVVAAAWNVYYFAIWRPRFDQRFPPDTA